MLNKQTSAITVSGTIVIYQEGFTVVDSYLKEGVLDKAGNIVIPFIYDEVGHYSEGLFCTTYRGKYGYLDANNKWAIEPIYDSAYYFSEGLAAVSIDDKYGFINKKNEIVIPYQYDNAYPFTDGLAFVEDKDGMRYTIDKEGALIFSHKYKKTDLFENSLSIVTSDDELKGAIDKLGNEVIPCIYQKIKCYECSKYLTATLPDATTVFYGWDGKEINDLFAEYDSIGTMYPEYQSVIKEGLYGLADQSGELIVSCTYTKELFVYRGDTLAITSKNGLYGAISIKTEEVVIPFEYVNINSCGEGSYILSLSSKKAIVVSSSNQELFRLNVDELINENFYASYINYDELDYSLLSEKKG